jgi:hypothetical protein
MLLGALSMQVFLSFRESTSGKGLALSGRLAMVQLGVSIQWGYTLVSRPGACSKNSADRTGSVKA